MKLVLAEKPQVARDLARVLKVPTASGSGCFEGPDYVITWCIGHLVELEEPAAYDAAWRRWSFSGLPMLPERFTLRPSKGTLKQWRVVRDLLRRRDFAAVINACDAGREGELIFRFCYELAGSRLPIERLWISSLTEQAILQGLRGLRPGRDYAALADAARCRAEADWLVGMNATRAVTLKRRETQDVLCSIGRVQTPTLALLVRREQQILAFVPQDYFEVHADLRPLSNMQAQDEGDGSFVAVWHLGKVRRLCPRDLADEVARRSTATAAAGPTAAVGPLVEHVESRTVREPPPLLFDLTSLQRTANRRFGLSAQRTLEVAQALYERHKLITYPRTDSRHLTADLIPQLPQIFRAVAGEPAYAPLVAPLLSAPPAPPPRVFRESKVSDHHAIIPTQVALSPDRLAGLTREERQLLDLIIRRFLGAFYPDAVFEQTRVVVRVGALAPAAPAVSPPSAEPTTILGVLPPPPDRYEARGRVRVQAGWQQAAGIDPDRGRAKERQAGASGNDDGDEGEANMNRALPKLAVGQPLRGAFRVEQKQTQPPPRYSEATLLSAMETAGQQIENEELMREMKDVGLGTPATRASIIETLIDRAYVERQGKVLHPTPLGVDLIEGLPVPSLSSPELTGRWEARLARIARGEEQRASFMADIAAYVREIVTAVRAAPAPAAVALHAAARPAGGRARSRGRGQGTGPAQGKRAATARTGKARGTRRRAEAKTRTPTRTRAGTTTRAGARALARDTAPAAPVPAPDPVPGAALGAPVEPALLCPRCGRGHLIIGRRGWGCSGYRQGCALVVPFEVLGRRLSEEDLRALVTLGATGPLTFHPPGGGPVRTRLRLSTAGSPLGFVYLET